MTPREQTDAIDERAVAAFGEGRKSRDEVERELSAALIEIRDRADQRDALRAHAKAATGP